MVHLLPSPALRVVLAAALALGALGAIAVPAAVAVPNRFDIGIHDPLDPGFGERDPVGADDAVRDAHIRVVRIPTAWVSIAPNKPLNPALHQDPAYHWGPLDRRVAELTRRGLEPLVVLYAAPEWAKSSTSNGSKRLTPNVDDFATFAAAAAHRYSGQTPGIARVRNWQLWNEPNLRTYLDPSDAVAQYRAMVKAAYPAVHAAAPGNRVVAGALAPYAAYAGDIAPLRFMRELLCMSAGSHPKPTCKASVPFDVWSHHPYTNGGPNRSARAADDASLGDLPEMNRLLRAAQHAKHVRPSGALDFWVTEFSWDTKGPDPEGVPLARHARWVAEAFYNMWRSDVSLAVWFQLRDNPKGTYTWGQTWQSGLYFRTTELYADEKAKPVLGVVRFPFVALPAGAGATVWGRTPTSAAGTVSIERLSNKKWTSVAKVKAGRYGIFRRTLAGNRGALLRARLGSQTAVPFRVERTVDHQVLPFGGDGQ
jgi:hypothetical protein